jgi:hypothetical protein
MRNLLKEVSNGLSAGLTILEGHPAEKKLGRVRATAFGYDKAIESDYGVIKDYVLTEINCFTDPVPYALLPVSSYIAQFFLQTGREALVAENHLEPVNVNVLSLERTFFEKMLSLNRLSYEGNDVLLGKIRHFYDLHQISHFPGLQSPILDPVHYPILQQARQNDIENKVMHGAWIGQRIQDSPLFTELDEIWQALTPSYRTELAELIWTGTLPSPEAILTVLQAIRNFAIAFDEVHPPTPM